MQRIPNSFRTIIENCEQYRDILKISQEIDPILEISGVEAAMEGGQVLLFQDIKGYPSTRIMGNVFSRRDRLARMFGVTWGMGRAGHCFPGCVFE